MCNSMRSLLCLLLFSACRTEVTEVTDALCGNRDQGVDAAAPADLVTPAAKCLAAKGLSGDNLVCVDFAKVPSLTDQALTGWDFVSSCGGNYWEIAGGRLQVKNFGTFADTCGFKMPSINFTDADKTKYSTITLSVVHRIDLNDPDQEAQIWLDSDTLTTRILWRATGRRDVARQTTTFTIDKADLPATLRANGFKWLFKVSSQTAIARNGWQIESLAINASP